MSKIHIRDQKSPAKQSVKKPLRSARTGLVSPRLTKKYVQNMKEKSPDFREKSEQIRLNRRSSEEKFND